MADKQKIKKLEHIQMNASIDFLESHKTPWVTLHQLTLIHIYQTLKRCNWNRTHAASELNISVRGLRLYVNPMVKMGFIPEGVGGQPVQSLPLID